jgi:hypothetical protein
MEHLSETRREVVSGNTQKGDRFYEVFFWAKKRTSESRFCDVIIFQKGPWMQQ